MQKKLRLESVDLIFFIKYVPPTVLPQDVMGQRICFIYGLFWILSPAAGNTNRCWPVLWRSPAALRLRRRGSPVP